MTHQIQDYVINDGQRFHVTVKDYHRQNDYILYQAHIFDAVYLDNYNIYFRFKVLKKLHESMLKNGGKNIPQFPKTRSFCFWNRTNDDIKWIKDRQREIQYYLNKVLNNAQMRNLQEVKYIYKSIRKTKKRRSKSTVQKRRGTSQSKMQRCDQCPQLYHKSFKPMTLL